MSIHRSVVFLRCSIIPLLRILLLLHQSYLLFQLLLLLRLLWTHWSDDLLSEWILFLRFLAVGLSAVLFVRMRSWGSGWDNSCRSDTFFLALTICTFHLPDHIITYLWDIFFLILLLGLDTIDEHLGLGLFLLLLHHFFELSFHLFLLLLPSLFLLLYFLGFSESCSDSSCLLPLGLFLELLFPFSLLKLPLLEKLLFLLKLLKLFKSFGFLCSCLLLNLLLLRSSLSKRLLLCFLLSSLFIQLLFRQGRGLGRSRSCLF